MDTSTDQIGQASPQVDHAREPGTLGRVLVVDKPRFSELISRMLAGRLEVVCVEDALAALGVFHRNRPDLIVADLSVRGGGLRLAELLDMNVAGTHTPFILTCIKPQADLVDRVKQVGIDTLLVKPFPPRTLMERIEARDDDSVREGELQPTPFEPASEATLRAVDRYGRRPY